MRLIDADALKTTRGTFIYQTEDADVIATEAYRWELIEREAPTVKAIPVEWIKKQIEKALSVDSVDLFYVGSLKHLIKEWEKKNESTRSDI